LNIGNAIQSLVEETLGYLFEYANSISSFYLNISMDIYASGAAYYADSASCNGLYDYANIFAWVLEQPSYYEGPNSHPILSSTASISYYFREYSLIGSSFLQRWFHQHAVYQ
jgi:hypothetical protein